MPPKHRCRVATPVTGQLAQFFQLNALGQQIGLANGLFADQGTVTSSYAVNLASLLAFFEFNTPADSANYQVRLNLMGIVDAGAQDFEYAQLVYSPAGAQRFFWSYTTGITLGSYHPGFCYNGNPCPPTLAAFVVSTTPPVPVPATVWLMLSGLTVCGLRRKLT
jgi:hypothetical protein